MLLGYNTNGLQNHRLDDALDLLADHGYRAVALTLDTCHLDPFRSSARAVDAVAAQLERRGLQPTIETGARFLLDPAHKHEPTLMTRDATARERRLEFYERAAKIGADLGAGVVSFWSGIDRGPPADAASWLRDGITRACELIRASGLVASLEPEPGMAIATMRDYAELRTAMGSEAPSLTLDVGHLYVDYAGDPADLIRGCPEPPVQVHLEDMVRGVHEHLLPGDGDVDFPKMVGALGELGYGGPVCFELSRHSHCAPDALRACSELWRQIG